MVAIETSGLLFSGFLGIFCRRLQVVLVGKEYPRSWNRLPGYLYSVGFFLGAYYVGAKIIENNRQLLDRRLVVLREQRAQVDAFHQFDEKDSKRFTPEKRSGFFNLMDRISQPYK